MNAADFETAIEDSADDTVQSQGPLSAHNLAESEDDSGAANPFSEIVLDEDDSLRRTTTTLADALNREKDGISEIRRFTERFLDEKRIRQKKKDSQLIRDLAFCNGVERSMPSDVTLFTELFQNVDDLVRVECANDKTSIESVSNSLKNAHGAWFEYLLAAIGWNTHTDTNSEYVAIALPNKSVLNIEDLYQERYAKLIREFRTKLRNVHATLATSNPDFVLVRRTSLPDDAVVGRVDRIDEVVLSKLMNLYTHIIHKCSFQDIAGYIGAKFTIRPDRRLQLPHEGSLMKALYVHVQTREWDTEATGLRYYAVTTGATGGDYDDLRTVSINSIIDPLRVPQRAVDLLYEARSIESAYSAFRQIYELCALESKRREAVLNELSRRFVQSRQDVKSINEQLPSVERMIKRTRKTLDKVERHIRNEREWIEARINKATGKLSAAIERRRSKLLELESAREQLVQQYEVETAEHDALQIRLMECSKIVNAGHVGVDVSEIMT